MSGLRELVEQALGRKGSQPATVPKAPTVDPVAQAHEVAMQTAKTQREADAVFTAITGYVKRRMAPLETRLAELEAFPFEYVGTHELQKFYAKNAVVTDAGSLWIALCSTEQRPGHGNDWQLCVKRGRDAR